MPTLTLDLVFREVEGEMVVLLPFKTRQALIALGWTSPAEPASSEESVAP
ncbi:hypothetical protein ACTWPT_31045 [Nonomuraea sp. 3N208]